MRWFKNTTDALHPELVDAKGDPASGRFWSRSYAARESLPFNLSEESIYSSQDLKTLKKAIQAISQTDIGCDILSAAFRMGVEIELNKEKCEQAGDNGFYSPAKKTVSINPDKSVADLSLTLIHELEHAMHSRSHLNFYHEDSLQQNVYTVRVSEDASRTVEGVFAYQVALIDKDKFYQPEGIVTAYEKKHKIMGKAARKAKLLAKQGNWQAFGEKLFEAFTKDKAVCEDYDLGEIKHAQSKLEKWISDYSNEPGSIIKCQADYMSSPIHSAEQVAEIPQIMGKPYIKPETLRRKDFSKLTPTPAVLEARKEFLQDAMSLNQAGWHINLDLPYQKNPFKKLCGKTGNEMGLAVFRLAQALKATGIGQKILMHPETAGAAPVGQVAASPVAAPSTVLKMKQSQAGI